MTALGTSPLPVNDDAPQVTGQRPVSPSRRPEPPLLGDFMRGIWKENPVLVQMLGMCPTMAVTNNVINSVAMGLATLFVLLGSEAVVSLLRRLIPSEVRIASYVLIIATFVTLADLILEALTPDVHKALGAFIALIVVNCLVFGRQEAFAAKQPVHRAVMDALGTGLGFALGLTIMGTIRELLGNGTFLGLQVMPDAWEPWVIMALPPGGFLTLGAVLLTLSAFREMRARRTAVRLTRRIA